MYRYFFKRFLDIVLSGIAMIALLPIYLVLAIIVRISMGSPILFSQERIGKGEKPFKLYKFRSMTNARDKEGNLLPEGQRVTRAGALIRSSSLDELPELSLAICLLLVHVHFGWMIFRISMNLNEHVIAYVEV